MIRINLLPARATRKKETAKQQIAIMVLALLLVAGAVGSVYAYYLAKVSSTKNQIVASEQEISELKVKIGEINNLKKLKEDVQKKLDVLNKLRKDKTGPVRRLGTISDTVPDKLWLTAYSESQDKVTISGIAFTEELIAEFMSRLQASNDYTAVELVVSEQAMVAATKVKKFQINCQLKPGA
jgi:type IV pilus assembly protein PilN